MSPIRPHAVTSAAELSAAEAHLQVVIAGAIDVAVVVAHSPHAWAIKRAGRRLAIFPAASQRPEDVAEARDLADFIVARINAREVERLATNVAAARAMPIEDPENG